MTEIEQANTVAEFLRDLSDLGRRLGLGINGGTVFLLEEEDYLLDYSCSDQSELSLGKPWPTVKEGEG